MFFSKRKFSKLRNKKLVICVLVVIVLVTIMHRRIKTDNFIPTSCVNDLKASMKKQNNNGLKSLTASISEQDQVNIEKQIKKDKEMIAKLCTNHKPIASIFRDRTIEHYYMDENMNVGWCFNAKVNYLEFE